jgi:hypothetical protein
MPPAASYHLVFNELVSVQRPVQGLSKVNPNINLDTFSSSSRSSAVGCVVPRRIRDFDAGRRSAAGQVSPARRHASATPSASATARPPVTSSSGTTRQ